MLCLVGCGCRADTYGVPNWWRAPLHDLALLIGCVMHGLLTVEQIRSDPRLPFTEQAIVAHIRRLYVESGRLPMGSEKQLHEYLSMSANIFPERATLEERIQRICVEVTREQDISTNLRALSGPLHMQAPGLTAAPGLTPGLTAAPGLTAPGAIPPHMPPMPPRPPIGLGYGAPPSSNGAAGLSPMDVMGAAVALATASPSAADLGAARSLAMFNAESIARRRQAIGLSPTGVPLSPQAPMPPGPGLGER